MQVAGHAQGWRAIEVPNGMTDGALKFLHRAEVVVVGGFGLEVSPVPLDEVQFGCVRCIPDQGHSVAVIGEKALNHLGVMNGTVVEEKKKMLAGVGPAEPFEVRHKAGRVLATWKMDVETSEMGIEGTENSNPAVLSSRRDHGLFTDQPPHPAQAGIEVELALVFKEEDISLGVTSPFLSAASRAFFACRTARRDWR